jgi:hypothetical protein
MRFKMLISEYSFIFSSIDLFTSKLSEDVGFEIVQEKQIKIKINNVFRLII